MADNDLSLDYLTSTYWRLVDLHYEATLDRRRITCPLCGHTAGRGGYRQHVSECQFGGGRLERYACPGCDLVFGPLKMLDLTPAQLALEYRVVYAHYDESDSTESEMRAFHACRPQPGGVYLNWGSGAWSHALDRLRAEGWDVWGYEPYVKSDSPYVVGTRAEVSHHFDGIFSNNLIEHLRDPVADLAGMGEHLAPGGVLSHSTACFDLLYENTRFHLFFFVGRSLELLAERSGFEIISQERDGEYMNAVFRSAEP